MKILNSHNKKLAEQGRKRRAMYLKLHRSGLSNSDLARRFQISRARMSQLLLRAELEDNLGG